MSFTKPTYMHYQKVADVIAFEPALQQHLSDKTETVFKPNGDKAQFPKEVIEVTDYIHNTGQDAHALSKMSKTNIIRVASSLLVSRTIQPLPAAKSAEACEEKIPVISKPRAPRRSKKAEKSEKTEKPKRCPSSPKALEADRKPDVVSAVVVPAVSIQPATVPLVIGCAVCANVLAAIQLLENNDKTLESKEDCEALDKIHQHIMKRTVIPSSMPRATRES